MTLTLDIFGAYIDNETERTDENDITPNIFKESIAELKKGDTLEIHVNSCGGNCTSGIAIANMIRQLNGKGVHTKCIVDGICASIATLTAMACKELYMYPQSFLMIHNPWTCIQGDAETLRKEAVSLDAMKKAILSFYHEKFDLSDEELEGYMNAETWVSGSDKDTYKLNANILEAANDFKIAAKMIDKVKTCFNKTLIIENVSLMENTIENEVKAECAPEEVKEEPKAEEVKQEVVVTSEETKEEVITEEPAPTEDKVEEAPKAEEPVAPAEEKPAEEKPEETKPTIEELITENEALKQKVEELNAIIADLTKQVEQPEDVDKRVSGMQAKMQNRINDITKDFNNQINEFKAQLEMKTKELDELTAKSISLKNTLDKTEGELHDCVSALAVKTQALDMLNAGVNTPAEADIKNEWKSLNGQAFADWCHKHPHVS